jgi:hypothetical protein
MYVVVEKTSPIMRETKGGNLMDKKQILKGLTALVPIAALGINFLADYLSNKERDEKYVSREELNELLSGRKESE